MLSSIPKISYGLLCSQGSGRERKGIVGEEAQRGEEVVVSAEVLEGLEAVRQSGAHMVERTHVLVLAKRMGYRQTVRWVEENPEDYARGIFHGFVAEE